MHSHYPSSLESAESILMQLVLSHNKNNWYSEYFENSFVYWTRLPKRVKTPLVNED